MLGNSLAVHLARQGQNWRDLPPALQPAAMGAGTFAAPGGKTGVLHRLSWDKPCPTLMCSPTQNTTAFCHPAEVRPLTVEEYAAIQTFPAGFALAGSTASKYRQLDARCSMLDAQLSVHNPLLMIITGAATRPSICISMCNLLLIITHHRRS